MNTSYVIDWAELSVGFSSKASYISGSNSLILFVHSHTTFPNWGLKLPKFWTYKQMH